MRAIFTIGFISLVLLGGCKAAEKQLRQGDFDQAIAISVKKLQNNPEKEKYIIVLEDAFRRANERDLAYIKTLHLDGQPDRWEKIYDVYQSIGRRQNKIAPLLPLYLENNAAEFNFIDIVSELIEAKKNASAYLYASAEAKLNTGNRYDAREAYYELLKIKELYNNYRDIDLLIDNALVAGRATVSYEIVNASNTSLNSQLEDAIYSIEPSRTNGMWYQFSNDKRTDMEVELRITKIEAFPEIANTNNYVETAEVEDGWSYLYDDEGHVVKDSLGNAIKVTKYETVSAYITETWQEKVATIEGEIRYSFSNGQILATIPVKADGVFTNYFAAATGYYDAISPKTREKLGGGPLPFPNDVELLLMARDIFSEQVRNAMNSNNDEVLNQ